ncbi:hypothetical protein EZV62_008000 [Acer yangbiense]|uniref:PARP-type domain-containing protein n=1 Tax=Acer yangbiense TaxID=1000413 RepID=A0A5C7ICC4_9ROSI|nr:hypothetical protein EZV62_008000 [Acer yangbiense]
MQFLYSYRATLCNPIISPYGFHFNKTLIHIHFHCFCSQKNPPRLSLSLPPMPPKIVTEYAKSDRSLCKKCSKAISKTALRLGSVLKNRGGFDSTHWHHLDCFPFNSEPIDSVESIQGFSSLESGDQEALKKLVVEGKNSAEEVSDGSKEGSQQLKQLMVQVTDEDRDEVGLEERKQKKHKNPPPAQPNTPRIIAEYAKSDRSSCKRCSKIISKKALRLGSVVRDPRGFESTKWHHVDCFPFTSEPIDSAESIQGFLSLESGDQEALKKLMVECKNSTEEVQVTNEGRDEVELEERSLKRSKILIPQNLDMTSLPNNGNASSAASNTASSPFLKRKSNDIGWEFGMLADATNPDKVKCKLCGKVFSGGVYRMKEHVGHITGNVSACPLATKEDQVRCKQAITDARNKKKNKKKEEEEIKDEVNIVGEEEEEMEGLGLRKKPNFLGPMDRFASVINPDSSMSTGRTLCQQNINEALFKERKHSVHQYVARWVYEAGIPFNAIDNDSFKSLVKAVGQFGPGFRPPSEYELRETLLNEEVEKTKEALKKHEEEWKLNGCSIITDAWTDIEGMHIINLCVNCKKGTTFLSSKESSIEAHTSEHIFKYVFKAIEQVGPENVVQVVTNNASNNMAAAKMLKEKMPNVFWTSCATQTINLMLESIGKIPRFKKTIDLAKTFTIFIYAHYKTLALMRIFTRKRDIVRWGVTRFATSFLTLQSLVEKKDRCFD